MPINRPPVQRVQGPSLPRKLKYLLIPDHTVASFFGLNTIISNLQKVTDGFSPDAINWITGDENDCIILRRGTKLLGQTRNTGAGKVTGLGVGIRSDAGQTPFFSYTNPGVGQKVKYYNIATDNTIEIGNNLLPLAAANDLVSIEPYQNLAGAFVYLSSINSDIYKIPVANPANSVAQSSTNFKGTLKFGQSRLLLVNNHGANGSRDLTGLYMSWIDRVILANYMQATITQTVGVGLNDATAGAPPNNLAVGSTYLVTIDSVGATDTFKWTKNGGTATTLVKITPGFPQYLADGVTVTFAAQTGHTNTDAWTITTDYAKVTENIGAIGNATAAGTVAKISGARTIFQLTVQAATAAGTETFTDDGNGVLASNFGGAGTVNYATGAVSAVFVNVPTGQPTTTYYWEDATMRGVLDFSIEYDTTANPPSRIAGSGRYFPQFDGGGNAQAVYPLANVLYTPHNKKTWQTQVPTNDDDTGSTPASNLSFRELMGISSPRGIYGSANGLYLINNANSARPQFYEILPKSGATSANIAAPKIISEFLDLAPFVFDQAVVYVWDIYALFSCQQVRNGQTDAFNSRTFLYNTKTGAIDLTDYPVSAMRDYLGSLIAGDPLSNNVFTLFSGFDDDGSLIPNHWTSGYTNHGSAGQKTTQRMVVNGLIQSAQRIKVSVAYDGGAFIDIFTIEGDGAYVDRSRSISVGNNTVGSKINGGGGEVFANPFEVEFGLNSDRYEYIRIRFEAINGGYAQINFYTYKIIKYKGERVPFSRIAS